MACARGSVVIVDVLLEYLINSDLISERCIYNIKQRSSSIPKLFFIYRRSIEIDGQVVFINIEMVPIHRAVLY